MGIATTIKTVERNVTALHRAVYEATDGRLFGRVGLMPVVMLTTTGRKTGQRRTTMLAAPVRDGDRVVLVASRGGSPRHPEWYLNLRANPQVELTMRGTTTPMVARVASPAEKADLWPRITRTYPGYALYQLRTSREIPVVILEPAPA